MPVNEQLLPEFDAEMANTRKALERIPADFGWKPHEKSMSLGRLATHIGEIPHWCGVTIDTAELDLAPPGAPPYQPRSTSTRDEVLAMFDKNVADARKSLAGASDQHLAASWSLLMTGKTLFSMPRIAVIRNMVINHLIHHRGQLTVYLRLLGIPVPALYGPSADEGQM